MKEVTVEELKGKFDAEESFTLIDVREPDERERCNIGGLFIPLGELQQRVDEISTDLPVIVYCRSGGRSGKAVEFLESQGSFAEVFNLKGGILDWADKIDPSIEKY